MDNIDILQRVDYLLALKDEMLASKWTDNSQTRVSTSLLLTFRATCLSFIDNLFGRDSVYFKEFDKSVHTNNLVHLNSGVGILKSIRYEIEHGWTKSYKRLVAAEIFTNILEMSEHLLDEGYDDAAAVMIGSTLEEHLRQLCHFHKVETFNLKGEDEVQKKAELLNADLKKAGVYGPLDQKQVTAWLSIRNSAAHGKYDEYKIEQVKLMYSGVMDFISRIK